MLVKFGTGSLYGVNTAANSTPVQFGGLQDVSVDGSGEVKELYGKYQFPIAVARGTMKLTGKAKFAQISGQLYNSLFFGATLSTGQLLGVDGEAASVPASAGPYTVVVANGATFKTDYGVTYAATGLAFERVAAGSEATGKYSVDETTGTYTFDSTDANAAVLISYSYQNATAGVTIAIANQLQGSSPFFKVRFNTTYDGKQAYYEYSRCVSSKFTMASKMSDWNIDEFDFSCFADSSGNVGYIGLAE